MYIKRGTWTRTRGRDEEALAVIELICQFANYTDEFVWWLRYAYVSPCVSAAFIDRKWIVGCFCTRVLCVRVFACVKILVKCVQYTLCVPVYTLVHTLVFRHLCVHTRVCARNRAYVTAWLGAQIQRAQLAHRTSRRIVLILRLHSREVETASSRLLPRATGCLCFKAERRGVMDREWYGRSSFWFWEILVRYFVRILGDKRWFESVDGGISLFGPGFRILVSIMWFRN